MDLGGICRYWGAWQPESVAVHFEGRAVTWSEFDQRTDAIAAGLAGLGVCGGERLGILGNNSVSWCELVVAACKTGAVVVPLNIRLSPDELAYITAHAGCAAVAVDADLAERYDRVAAGAGAPVRIRMEGAPGEGPTVEDLAASRPHPSPVEAGEDDVAVIAYTSGTTGRPKGAMLTQRNLLAHVELMSRADGWTAATRTLLCVPLAFTGGIVNNFLATYGVGGTLVLERTFEPARALRLLTEHAVSTMIGVPVMWQGIADVPGFAEANLTSLTTAITGGAPVPEGLLRTYQAKGVLIRQAYGLTEATALVALLPAARAVERPKAAGMPVLHTAVRIVDEGGHDRPAGETGEILVRGPQVMAGYWADEAATATALAGGWLHTGDVGRFDDDGLLEIVDRKNDLIIAGGLNVYPAEIERVLHDYPGVVEAAVVGVPDPRWGEVPAAIVRGAGPLDTDAVVAHCRRLLADYKTPRHVVVVDDPLPRSMSGKVLRRELRAKYQALGGLRPPRTPQNHNPRQENSEMPVKFGTVDFYQAMADQLNNDPAWPEIGKDLSYSMVYVFTEPVDKRFYAVFDGGKVTGVREATEADAEAVDFVITGPPDVWRGIFEKKINPTAALTTGKMKVKGKMTTLLKNMKAFSYVIEAMTRVDFE